MPSLFNQSDYLHLSKIAELMANASLMPDHLRGWWKQKPGMRGGKWNEGEFVEWPIERRVANAMLIVSAASRFGCDPFALANESYETRGKVDFSGKVYIALANQRAGLTENLRFDFEGEDLQRKCICIGTPAGGHERRTSSVLEKDATRDNDGRISPQWAGDPDRQLRYSAARKWVRANCPETTLGFLERAEEVSETQLVIDAEYNQIEDQRTVPAIEEKAETESFALHKKALEAAQYPSEVRAISKQIREDRTIGKTVRDQLEEKGGEVWARISEQSESAFEHYADKLRAAPTPAVVDQILEQSSDDKMIEVHQQDKLVSIANGEPVA